MFCLEQQRHRTRRQCKQRQNQEKPKSTDDIAKTLQWISRQRPEKSQEKTVAETQYDEPLFDDSEDDDDDFVCFPIGQEDCETCEYMEDWSEYYGERVPSARMFLPTAALTLCP